MDNKAKKELAKKIATDIIMSIAVEQLSFLSKNPTPANEMAQDLYDIVAMVKEGLMWAVISSMKETGFTPKEPDVKVENVDGTFKLKLNGE